MTVTKNTYTPFVWDDRMSTGVEVIDAQHQNLLNMVNDAYGSLSETTSKVTFQRITKELLSYAIYHFQTEESLMNEYGYNRERPDEAGIHIKEHRDFSAKVVAARKTMNSGAQQEIIPILEFLQSWIANHTQDIDMKLGRYIQEKEAERAAK
ncbi:MAG: bacteriohemerythrin [Candidatus Thiodiazotropha sp. (ex Monitilora ramsayi)]|nr:bacteriohemerythrin [Candidatus Thiodiazotropha sp. (ex Monitilora ramsayi)]